MIFKVTFFRIFGTIRGYSITFISVFRWRNFAFSRTSLVQPFPFVWYGLRESYALIILSSAQRPPSNWWVSVKAISENRRVFMKSPSPLPCPSSTAIRSRPEGICGNFFSAYIVPNMRSKRKPLFRRIRWYLCQF